MCESLGKIIAAPLASTLSILANLPGLGQGGPWKRPMVWGFPKGLDDGRAGYISEVDVVLPPSRAMQAMQTNYTWLFFLGNDGLLRGGPFINKLDVVEWTPGGKWRDTRSWAWGGIRLSDTGSCGAVLFILSREGFSGVTATKKEIRLPLGTTMDAALFKKAESHGAAPTACFTTCTLSLIRSVARFYLLGFVVACRLLSILR